MLGVSCFHHVSLDALSTNEPKKVDQCHGSSACLYITIHTHNIPCYPVLSCTKAVQARILALYLPVDLEIVAFRGDLDG